MKIIIFFFYIPLVYSGIHIFKTTYTGIRGQTVAGIPEFFAVSLLDGQQIDYYDSNTMKLIPKQDWIEEFASEELWTEDTEIRLKVQQIYKNNIPVLMKRFNQSNGVHTYQRRYGCEWDDETEESGGFDQYGYDGEDFISLDLKELRYITTAPQGTPTVKKWSDDREQLEFLKQHYDYECVYWLKALLKLRKEYSQIKAPEVFLLQKDPSFPVSCLATGFYPSEVSITWFRNGQEHYEDVDLGDTLPNEDGTFQRKLSLILPEDWEKDQYSCEVVHMTGIIQKILTDNEIKSNNTVCFNPLNLIQSMDDHRTSFQLLNGHSVDTSHKDNENSTQPQQLLMDTLPAEPCPQSSPQTDCEGLDLLQVSAPKDYFLENGQQSQDNILQPLSPDMSFLSPASPHLGFSEKMEELIFVGTRLSHSIAASPQKSTKKRRAPQPPKPVGPAPPPPGGTPSSLNTLEQEA
ncbi:major histocompatibility complex class I-related gene protein-like [Pseudorasbora parva]|uniref:major histocompatibility complex class I-related gene protein-like n=1 Tax=Pseudorasbora parva TaxID=51549 RepID=UPI00351E627F